VEKQSHVLLFYELSLKGHFFYLFSLRFGYKNHKMKKNKKKYHTIGKVSKS
jgi:hypothetical protein